MTIFSWIIVCGLLAGWYFMPMMLRDMVVWSHDTVSKAIAYFKKYSPLERLYEALTGIIEAYFK